ncbi:hypothetical protein DBIPINDM_008347 (plasmid) [Mesorhizobium sp. AR02]|uniref:hypothetical protein n=1 Tax=Mesorhizobium sp. AR02 TaxID=2865837 RepID=UPI002160FF88|nr:hypothetical protein [Mesorhizobium sp. AR02]UVK57396.1 hypothetical protein DBIPINDM_008347 [Mesorhizobium sp. AR02]
MPGSKEADLVDKFPGGEFLRFTAITLQSDTAANKKLRGKPDIDPTDYDAVDDPSKLPNVFPIPQPAQAVMTLPNDRASPSWT